ncbi:12199_t:CDS:2 [Entrophospora sp. SA101]|nr:12199_t:CDS:2 [Entrophospora sp. SA101]
MKAIGILGKKISMTQLPVASGEFRPVTAILVSNNIIVQVKTEAKEGYNSCQIAFEDCSKKNLNKPLLGHLNKKSIPPKRHLREIRNMAGFEVGSPVDLALFQAGEKVKVSGTSKGKGTQGVIKKYGYSRGNMTHGGGYPHRLIGSMGGGRGTNQGVPKGKKMPSRMGNEKTTQKSIIEKIDKEKQIIFIRGSVPVVGVAVGGYFLVRKKDNKQKQGTNLGEQQRQQVREAASQLVGNILDNQSNFNQLTTNPDGTRRNIDDVEEIFLSSGGGNQSSQITNSLSPAVLEQSWYELRPFIIACLQNLNQSLIEKEYLRAIQELKTIKELFEKYSQIRNNLVINKKRIGITNALSAISGLSRELLLFLKPSNNQSPTVYFPPDKIEQAQQDSVRVAHYLALYSALNKIPLPRNLASTATIKGEKVGGIGGLQHKLEASVNNGIDTFILSNENKKDKNKEQIHFISSVDQIKIALNEILNGNVEEKVHNCGKDKKPEEPQPRDPPQPDKPNSEITSEQLLSLVAEYCLREVPEDQRDFKNKLMSSCHNNSDYQGSVVRALKLREEYLGKLEKIQTNPQRNENQGKIGQLQKEIFYLTEQIRQLKSLNNKEDEINQLVKQIEEKNQEIKTLSENDIPHSPEENIEKRKKQLYQEYETKFKEIASIVANLTSEILTNLTNLSYNIKEIK